MSGGAGPSKKPKLTTSIRNGRRTFSTMSYSKCVCLICQVVLCHKGSCSYARYSNLYCIYEVYSVYILNKYMFSIFNVGRSFYLVTSEEWQRDEVFLN